MKKSTDIAFHALTSRQLQIFANSVIDGEWNPVAFFQQFPTFDYYVYVKAGLVESTYQYDTGNQYLAPAFRVSDRGVEICRLMKV